MARTAERANPPCPRCGYEPTVRTGHTRGQQRWRCAGCRRSFGPTTGTVAHALLVVLQRGSLLAAEELTGRKYETIGRWLRQAATHAEALTAALVMELHLTEVEVDEFWSFVHQTGAQPKRPAPCRPVLVSGGAA